MGKKIFATGTMRTGGSLVQNLISVNSEVIMFSGLVNYFRFIYKKYDPLTAENVERMINHFVIRVKYRRGFNLDANIIISNILNKEITYASCYDEVMKGLLNYTDKKIWGEYVTLGWRYIPTFIDMYPQGKVLHVYRDLRAIISSFGRMTNMPGDLYLNVIFNWIDSVNHIMQYGRSMPKDRYMAVKFESIHEDPDSYVRSICDFLEIRFEKAMVDPKRWQGLFDKKFVDANISSYTMKKVYGFDYQRTQKWQSEIKDWELFLAEYFAREQMQYLGYDFVLDDLKRDLLDIGISKLKMNKILNQNLDKFVATGEGTDKAAVDPTDPKNWDAGIYGEGNPHIKFTESAIYEKYTKELDDLEMYLENKY